MVKEKTDMKNRVMVCVCTYNEKDNIQACIQYIKQNGIDDILVVDASTDNTKELAERAGARVVSCEKGLAGQRQVAINLCDKEYLVFVDADDRIEEDCIEKIINVMNEGGYAAVQAQVRVYKPKTYWQKAIDATWQYSMFKEGPTNMVGRPAVYNTEIIKKIGADVSFSGIGNEDTAISVRVEQAGYTQAIGNGISYRICHASFRANKKEWIKYGKGDAMIIKQYPEKKWAIYRHTLFEYPIRRSWQLIKNKKGIYCLYPICIGLFRFGTLKLCQWKFIK